MKGEIRIASSSRASLGLESDGQAVVDGHVVKETRMRRDRGAELYVLGAQEDLVKSEPHFGTGQPRSKASAKRSSSRVETNGGDDTDLKHRSDVPTAELL